MINETPEFPAFTDWAVRNGILREPMRIIDVGVQGGLHPRWRWLGDHLEAWAFDPLPDVIAALSAQNPAPERLRYFCMGLGNENGERLFSRDSNPYGSAFLPAVMTESDIGHNAKGELPDYWSRPTIRKLDTLMAQGLFSGIDHIKLDCEGFEIEILRGAKEFLAQNSLFAIETESNLKLHPWHAPCHFSEFYHEVGPRGFDVYDITFYRDTRAPLAGGYPNRGRPDTFDFLFLRGVGVNDDLSAHTPDQLIKRIIVAELYAQQDIGADILQRSAATLSARLNVDEGLRLLASSR